MSTITDRVAAGVAWLDEHVLGWQDRVVVEQIEMASVCRCVLGQIFGSFYSAPLDEFDQAAALGFDARLPDDGEADIDVTPRDFMALAEEWERVITERRAAA